MPVSPFGGERPKRVKTHGSVFHAISQLTRIGNSRRLNLQFCVFILVMYYIAVGTRVTARPPHRSRRAVFPHRAPTLGV
jgi:hypothetical protein